MTSRNIGDLERNKFFAGDVSDGPFSLAQCSDHFFSIAKGVSGYSYINKFGRVVGASTSMIDVTDLATPAVYAWLTTASKLEAISSSANDTADGSGARTIIVEGLDANFEEISETITMAGLSASTATTNSFIRVHRAYIATSGSYATTSTGSHAGNITIRLASAGATQIYLRASASQVGQSFVSRYTIPANKTGYLMHAFCSVDSNKSGTFWLWRRLSADVTSAPFGAKRAIDIFDGIKQPFERTWTTPIKLEEKTDIWFSLISAGADTNASAAFDILLVDN